MAGAPLRAGLIGLGMMGRHHARVLRGLSDVTLVGVADPMGDPHGVAVGVPLCRTVEELLALGLDYCVVAAPTACHEELGLALAAAGVHALVEKPLAQDIPSARRVAQAFEDAGLIGAVGHIERYNPALQQLRARLEEGQLGSVYQVVTRRQGPFPNRISDVGVVKDLATHDIDLTAWVTGQSYRSVSARTAYKSGRDFEDLVAVVGQLADGTVTNHLVNWLSPIKERVTVVTGERGCLIADTLNVDLSFHNNAEMLTQWEALRNFRGVSEGDMIRYAIAKPEPLLTEHEAFRDAVLGKDTDIVTMRQGLVNVVVAQAMLDSASGGLTVAVDA
ncbi:Gfo/Idh/MocA family protein [Yinghuangia seranimata]|uniref:Gfo/Idh/MocA family protein n=1 Tax=Yinghuangia seranimata TaxID=408067 RepID=UPI00248CFCE2|nr:Gfo/Idh/MocA family oxidoreductase [Yinghuangia seranimata]MDI2132258.1 Gfo/Idh/MocA family oxidoreductase [Yinghuangia seranimata]